MSVFDPQTISEKRAFLEAIGFKIGERDPRGINTDFPGAFMVAEEYSDDELPTKDGSNGPWCVVGDNLDELIEIAFNAWFDPAAEAANIERAVWIARRYCE